MPDEWCRKGATDHRNSDSVKFVVDGLDRQQCPPTVRPVAATLNAVCLES